MRTTDIIRAVLDLLDRDEQERANPMPAEQGEPEASRFKQIFTMLSTPSKGPLGNSPNEVVADIEAVTTLAGGGLNGPKDPAGIRVKDPGGYE